MLHRLASILLRSLVLQVVLSVALTLAISAPAIAAIVRSDKPHEVQLLPTGSSTLAKALSAIRGAQRSIDLEYWEIHFCDRSTQLLLQEIFEKIAVARAEHRPFRVRILVDHFLWNKINPTVSLIKLTEDLRARGIELRFFNPVFSRDLGKRNQRIHRKGMVIDGEQVISGGRNLSDEFFAVNPDLNRVDKDIWVRGPIAEAFLRAYDEVWNSELTQEFHQVTAAEREENRRAQIEAIGMDVPALDVGFVDSAKTAALLSCLERAPSDKELLGIVRNDALAIERSMPIVKVNSVIAGLDSPGRYKKKNSFVPHFLKFIGAAERSVLLENQYFIPDQETYRVFDDLKRRKVPVIVVTNSLMSEDDRAAGRLTHKHAFNYSDGLFQVFGFNGVLPRHPGFGNFPEAVVRTINLPGRTPMRWQMHSKAGVIDDRAIWIGSNNIDPRSNSINIEQAIFIPDSPEFARIVSQSIRFDLEGAVAMSTDSPYWRDYVEKNPDWLSEKMLSDLIEGFY